MVLLRQRRDRHRIARTSPCWAWSRVWREPFPLNFLSAPYRSHWWRYSQFFMGPGGSVTPLHFDRLLTHNLFFQIFGAKQFIILPPSHATYCGRRGWRWFDVDPEQPNYVRFPQYKRATPVVITVNAGDILYMPPGTLHHVRSLSTAISLRFPHGRERIRCAGVVRQWHA